MFKSKLRNFDVMELEGVILRCFIFNIPKIRNMIKFDRSESILVFSLFFFFCHL